MEGSFHICLLLTLARSTNTVLDEVGRLAGALPHPPVSVIVFGSFARREAGADSDIDVVVVRPAGVDEDEWSASLEAWRIRVTTAARGSATRCGPLVTAPTRPRPLSRYATRGARGQMVSTPAGSYGLGLLASSLGSRDCKVPVGLGPALTSLGVDGADVLAVAGLPSRLLDLPAPWIPVADYFALWQAIGEVSGDAGIGVRLAASIDAEQTEPLFLAVLSAPNLATAIDVTGRYKRMISPDQLSVSLRGPDLSAAYQWPAPFDVPPATLVDAELAFLVEIARRATRRPDSRPRRLDLRRASLEAGTPHADYFNCPVRLGAAANAVVFDASEAQRQFLTHNPALLAALDVHLNAAVGGADGFGHRARVVVSRRLRGRRPTLEEVSAELAISSRSLQRALHNEGSSFRSLLDEVRNRHALHYLRTTNFSDVEIAYLIGFQETSSFYRAFRSWNGGTPGEFRQSPVRGPSS